MRRKWRSGFENDNDDDEDDDDDDDDDDDGLTMIPKSGPCITRWAGSRVKVDGIFSGPFPVRLSDKDKTRRDS